MMHQAIPYRPILLLLCGIFAARVVIQFILQFTTVGFLPSFDLWHSEAMPYPVLFTLQCILLVLMLWGAWTSPQRKIRPLLGSVLVVLGLVYLFSMLARLAIGLSGSSDRLWFEGAVPTAIHFVLISYVLVLGVNFRGYSPDTQPGMARRTVRVLGYPVVLIAAYLLFTWMLSVGAPLIFSAYLTVLVGVTVIILHETFIPHREDWQPHRQDLITDGAFLLLVQIALPILLKACVLWLIVVLSQNGGVSELAALWPHGTPVLFQVVLMMVVAEFFRYWIHRASHKYTPLWKLHAVHHAADKLYTINVGRFHPMDKAIQFLGDTLPFLLFGLAPEVFAVYFVLYALNGFYQHSNADVALGMFNWIIAGPELHRWHHSANYKEANANFGNNLILWDAIFATRLLPTDRMVGRVGIGNPKWPAGFLAQLIAPFTTSTQSSVSARQDSKDRSE